MPFQSYLTVLYDPSKKRTLVSKNKEEVIEFELRIDFPSFLIDKSFVENCDSWSNNEPAVKFYNDYGIISVDGDHWRGPVTDVILKLPQQTITIYYERYFEGEKVGLDNFILQYNDNGKILLANENGEIIHRYKLCCENPKSNYQFLQTGSEFNIDLNEDDFISRSNFFVIRQGYIDKGYCDTKNPKVDIILGDDEFLVKAPSGLNLRSQPSSSSNVILKLDYLDKVRILEKTNRSLTIKDYDTLGNFKGNIDGFWVKVKSIKNESEYQGYVFDGYLEKK